MHSRRDSGQSEFLRALGRYHRPGTGEAIPAGQGEARISRILSYADVVEEMKSDGASREEIEGFALRVEHFLGKKSRYFECDLAYTDGETERIDWSEYLAMKNRGKR